MKCALELQMIATVKAEENRRAEAEAEKRKAMILQEKTIAECERIGMILEELAEKGKSPIYRFYVDRYWRVLKETYKDYADGRLSYNPTSLEIDINTMKKWFKQYCFDVEIKNFRFYQYWLGINSGGEIIIRPSAECLK